jgi:hypothetical protein
MRRAGRSDGTGRGLILLALPLLISAVVYCPILVNYFWGDDFTHLWEIADWGFVPFLVKLHGGHVYLLRNLVFYATYQLFGFDPQPYFACVLATHLVNVLLLVLLLTELEASPTVAVFGAALWGILPVHEGTLGWYSAYGQVLSATALLWFLREVVRAAKVPARLTSSRVVGWCAVLLAGAVCHGTGLIVTLVAGLVAFLLLPRSASRSRTVAILCAFVVVTPLLYAGCMWLDARLAGGSGRLNLLPANLRRAAPLIGEAWVRLLENASASTLLPHVCVGQPGWWPCGALAVAFAVAVAVTMVGAAGLRRQLVAWLILLLAVYATIAVTRAPIAWFFRLTLPQVAAGARFHYLGTLPVVLMLSGLLAQGRRIAVRPAWLGPALLMSWIGVVIGTWLTAPGIDHHDAARLEAVAVIERINTRIDGAPPDGTVYLTNETFAGVDRRTFPGSVALYVITQPSNVVRGRRVYFREPDPAVLVAARARPGRRTPMLLVGADE